MSLVRVRVRPVLVIQEVDCIVFFNILPRSPVLFRLKLPAFELV
jgi:hypothetical protein